MNLIFEEVKDSDIESILNIYNYYILNSTATFHKNTLTIDDMKGILYSGHEKYSSYTINVDGSIAGYCLLARYKTREAFDITAEVTLYLKPGYEGLGIGKKAVTFLEEVARERDFKTLLSVICGENSSSIKLFEKCGFEKCAHYKNVGMKFDRYLDLVTYYKDLTN